MYACPDRLRRKERIHMRKSGLYASGLYVQGIGSYYNGRKAWKKRRKYRGWKQTALLLLVLAAGVLAVSGGMKRIKYGQPVFGERESSELPADVLTAQEPVSEPAAEEELPVIPEAAVGSGEKEPEDIIIVLDPGHGGADEGCSRDGIEEKDINLQIALAVRTGLEALGYQVLLTRDSDRTLTLEERVRIANEAHGDIYVSIHQNASDLTDAEGIEVLYSSLHEEEASERLSKLVQKYAVQSTEAFEREMIEEEELYVIRECTMPSCLIETGFLSNAAECGRLTDSDYQKKLAEGIVSGVDLFFRPKIMYLTFDDGPSEENTGAVLDILKARGIKATFFVVGENVRKHPEVARRIVEEGHTIGIHCNRHEYTSLYASADSYLKDFEEAYDAVKEVTGAEAKLFRFPGGSINSYNKAVYEEIIEEMTKRGFIYYDWNASLEDAVSKTDAESLIRNAVDSTLGRKKVVMLAHDIVYETTQCLDELLGCFPEYRMEPLTEDVTPIQF